MLLLAISGLVIHAIHLSNDSVSLWNHVQVNTVGILWLFPISIPVGICIVLSLIKSLSLKTFYNKIVFSLHLFNICAIPIASVFLPDCEEPTIKMMAENYKLHQRDFMSLEKSVNILVKANIGIDYQDKHGNVVLCSIQTKDGKWHSLNEFKTLYAEKKIPATLAVQLRNISKCIKASNLQGALYSNMENKLTLFYSQYGLSTFVYVIYFSEDVAHREYAAFGNTKSYYKFNESTAFVRDGVYPGTGAFSDFEQFSNNKLMKR